MAIDIGVYARPAHAASLLASLLARPQSDRAGLREAEDALAKGGRAHGRDHMAAHRQLALLLRGRRMRQLLQECRIWFRLKRTGSNRMNTMANAVLFDNRNGARHGRDRPGSLNRRAWQGTRQPRPRRPERAERARHCCRDEVSTNPTRSEHRRCRYRSGLRAYCCACQIEPTRTHCHFRSD